MIGFYHTAVVSRLQTTTTAGKQSTAEVTIHAALPCRMAPLDARTQNAIFGDFSSERRFMEWGTEAIQEGDLVAYGGRTFTFSSIRADVDRPAWSSVPSYQTGALTIQKKSRRAE